MKYDILIFNGQSNMQGQSEKLLDESPVPGCYEYKFITDELALLNEPVGENILNDGKAGYDCKDEHEIPQWVKAHALGASYHKNTTMVSEFVRAYTVVTGHNVVAVHAAKGSTRIKDWQKGTAQYSVLVEKAKAAIAKVGKTNIRKIYFIFLQGESDALAETPASEYLRLLELYNDDLKKELNIDKFCIIKVGAFATFFGKNGDEDIFAAQEKICSENGDFIMLTEITGELTKTAEYMNPNFKGHYSAAGQVAIGRRAGERLGIYASGKTLANEIWE